MSHTEKVIDAVFGLEELEYTVSDLHAQLGGSLTKVQIRFAIEKMRVCRDNRKRRLFHETFKRRGREKIWKRTLDDWR